MISKHNDALPKIFLSQWITYIKSTHCTPQILFFKYQIHLVFIMWQTVLHVYIQINVSVCVCASLMTYRY